MVRIFWAIALIATITTIVFTADATYSLSDHYFWYDNIQHLLGGAVAGLLGMWFGLFFTDRATLQDALLCGAVLGVLVEIVEYSLGIGGSRFMSYSLDTAKDLIVDMIGAGAAWYVMRRA
jgi:hypothetical protein